jgi:hypothetical protein
MGTIVTPIPTRLRWDGKSCFIRHDSIEVMLPFVPPIFSKEIAEIDYAPTMGTKQIREMSDRWRDMGPAEFDLLLACMTLFIQDTGGAAQRLVEG